MATHTWLALALRLPVYLLAVGLLFWAVPLAYIGGFIRLQSRRGRNDMYNCSRMQVQVQRVKAVRAGAQQLSPGPRCMYLCNHRTWADFFIDTYITEGRAMPLSRGMVAVAFPALILPLMAVKAILVFNLNRDLKDIESFNRRLDRQLEESRHNSFLVYPEGRRGTARTSQPLRRGMLKYAYSRGLPVQIVMAGNKEAVLAEKEGAARFGQAVVVSFSEVLDPAKHSAFEAFLSEVQSCWDLEWERVYTTPLAGLPPVCPPADGSNLFSYSAADQAKSVAAVWASVAVLLACFACWAWVAAAVARAAGGWSPVGLALIVGWCAASWREAWQAVDLRGGGVHPAAVARGAAAGAKQVATGRAIGVAADARGAPG